MKAKLQRTLPVYKLVFYASLNVSQDRSDIKDYLEKHLQREDGQHPKIQAYLQQIHLLDNNKNLTIKGQNVVSTGKLATPESGKYCMWTLQDDPLVGNYVLALKREGVQRNNELKPLSLPNFIGKKFKTFILKQDDKKLETIELKDFGLKNKPAGNELKCNDFIVIRWDWEDNETAALKFDGLLKEGKQSIVISQPIRSPYGKLTLEKLLLEIVPAWQGKHGRLAIDLEGINNETLQHFIRKSHRLEVTDSDYGDFSEVVLSDVPVMPKTKLVADKWLLRLIGRRLEQGFCMENEFLQMGQQLSKMEPLSYFQLKTPTIDKVLTQAVTKRNKNASFWNLATPCDLNPFAKASKETNIYELVPTVRYKFDDLAKELVPKARISQIVFADRYVKTTLQKRSFEMFMTAIRQNANACPINLFVLSDSISNYKATISDINVFPLDKRSQDHDRFLIFITEKEEWIVWQITRSIDYLKFPNSQFNEMTEGICRQGVTFVKTTKRLLTPNFKRLIQQQVQSQTITS